MDSVNVQNLHAIEKHKKLLIIDCANDNKDNRDNELNVVSQTTKTNGSNSNKIAMMRPIITNPSKTYNFTSSEKSIHEGVNYKSPKRLIHQNSFESLHEVGTKLIDVRSKFRRSHTCGSLFAKCNCSTPSPISLKPSIVWKTTTSNAAIPTKLQATNVVNPMPTTTASTPNTSTPNKYDDCQHATNNESTRKSRNIDVHPQSANRSQSDNNSTSGSSPSEGINIKSAKKSKRLFQSYSHPDTSFIFTDENKNPSKDTLNVRNNFVTKDGKVEFKHPKRSSSPNIGHYTILDVAVHPDILVKISPKLKHLDKDQRNNDLEKESTSDSENSIEVLSTSCEDQRGLSENPEENREKPQDTEQTPDDNFNAAQKYFEESGILGPIQSTNLIRKTSKILQDSNIIEQIRKTSKILRTTGKLSFSSPKGSPPTGYDEMDCLSAIPLTSPKLQNVIHKSNTSQSSSKSDDEFSEPENKIKSLEDEILSLKHLVSARENEICKLKREIHKLKSVLQQTTNHMPITNDELLTTDQRTSFGSLADQGEVSKVTNDKTNSTSYTNNYLSDRQLMVYQKNNESLSKLNNNENNYNELIRADQPVSKAQQTQNGLKSSSFVGCAKTATASCALDVNDDSIKDICLASNSHKSNQLSAPVLKKQGVSGESCDTSTSHNSFNAPIPKYEKDFRSKQLIKDAIMDNDFLKNIDSSQVRELVESMYSLEVAKGEYVIREGEAGAHLYVSASGEFEVIKNAKVLGVMGPGKAFGELAILYNCTRTASIRVLSDASVWVLDRRVFQQIMMRTGMQRIEDNVNFLKSVPLLKNLSNDVLAKISDVLEVEFYPAGTYIIRQGASGDTFFLISQGQVKVTQKLANSTEEKEIRTLERGDYFGEQALINEDKRTANIIALAPGVECLTLDRESFTHLIGDLCELKEKNYGDENRVLAMKFAEQAKEIFGANVKQEFPDMQLSDLDVVATLGIGGFGRVELVKCYRENEVRTFALKCLKKKHIIDTRQEEHVFSERTIMLTCDTPFICRLYRTFRDSKYVYMLLEACMGGEVWTILRDRGSFNENTTQFIIGCVLQAFEYLHSRGIIYRDLKPENLMLDERGYVKLVDFGFAKHIGNSNKTWTFCGTPEYVAPEIILNKGHDRAVDYWALGILIHELLNGTPPFTANDPMKTYNIILKGIDMIDFPKHMPRAAVMLIKKLCRDVPAERLGYQKGGIQDIKKHKWFQGFDWDGLSNLCLIPPFLRPVSSAMDTSYFDNFPVDCDVPPDETSGWDADF